MTVVELKSGFALLPKVNNKTSEALSQALIDRLKPYEARTMTYDNRKEFTDHARIDAQLDSIGYFADPFTCLLSGSDENLNGLSRQYLPKQLPLSTVMMKNLKQLKQGKLTP